jgi:hypothetical protein
METEELRELAEDEEQTSLTDGQYGADVDVQECEAEPMYAVECGTCKTAVLTADYISARLVRDDHNIPGECSATIRQIRDE